ncbi:hypothetical protein H6G64_35415 [Calothrix sp. FACHB-156]|nr:hypothetical protein [Calothrix sp. FACHB-156]
MFKKLIRFFVFILCVILLGYFLFRSFISFYVINDGNELFKSISIAPTTIKSKIIDKSSLADTLGSDLENIINKLPEGQIAYNIPTTMYVGEKSFVKVNLTKDLSLDISREFGNDARLERLKVNTFMKIDLIGDSFDIKNVSDLNQVLPNKNLQQWEWIVLPKDTGNQDLIIKVSARFKLSDGSQENYTLKTIRKSVEVKNNPQYFLGQNWKWFIEMAIALGVGGVIGNNLKVVKNLITRKGKSFNNSSGSTGNINNSSGSTGNINNFSGYTSTTNNSGNTTNNNP